MPKSATAQDILLQTVADLEKASEAGKKGGAKTSANREHMAAIGRMGGIAKGQRARDRARTPKATATRTKKNAQKDTDKNTDKNTEDRTS